jgi:hypothetical protein
MKIISIDIGFLLIFGAVLLYAGVHLGAAWDRYWSNRPDYFKLKAERDSLTRLAQSALASLTQWQERALAAEAKLQDVGEFSEYIEG